ncbi:hypothetical protein FA13DRAFT_890774 [Coprinellus micaceus]|uniref:Uncharacterized protein n=1 Tax=Coprinellus micaceus TaxID=71717 RepID=A0A4Y7TSP0_COPMI|nr:hypothetical protein FA13DRAFT_890774 [Coprinellus micaceus]
MSALVMDQDPPLDHLGSPPFFSELITYVRSISTFPTLPVDQVIIKSVLLCLIAGDKHLILRTPEEDIGLVVKLVAWTLTHVFHYATHRVKIRSRIASSPKALLQSLFLPKPGRRSRSGSNLKVPLAPSYNRSISFPNDLSQARSQSPEPLHGIETQVSSSPRLQHSLTEPAPTRSKPGSHELPHALILSGLERASSAVQQELSSAIADKRVTLAGDGGGVWKFPDGFIVIYICSIHSTERPRIHKSLLDKFAMSHNILVSQSSRQALRSISFSPMHSFSQTPSFSQSNSGSPTTPYTTPLPQTPPYYAKPLPTSQPIRQPPPQIFTQEPFPQSFIETLRKHCRKTHLTPELGLYLSDLFSAARHHPRLDAMLLTAKARKDAEHLARAARVIGSDLTGMELVRPESTDDDESEYFDAQSDTRYGRTIDESSTTNLLRKDSFMYGGSASRISTVSRDDEEDGVVVLDVTEVDVARTMPRIVSHRLSLRSGPEDEILASAVMGATFGGSDGLQFQKGYGGLTIKDVLVDILNKVAITGSMSK